MAGRRPATRRDFLTGRAAIQAAGDLLPEPAADQQQPSDAAGPPSPSQYLVHVGRRAMACQFEIYFSAERYPAATELAAKALDMVDWLEDQMSIYRPESHLCAINRQAAQAPVPVEAELFDLLEVAQRIARETRGALDITSGPLSAAWGFLKRAGSVPSDAQIEAARARVGHSQVLLDPLARTIRFSAEGVEINVNSIGKGFALDRCAALLEEGGMQDFLIHGGQSSVLARGSRSAQRPGWIVGLRHPMRPRQRLAEFCLRDRCLGTSGSGTQFFHHRGRRFGHVIDPRSGHPADGVLSSTVVAPSAAEADALATAFYVMGHEAAGQYCREHPKVGMLLVCPATRQGGIELYAEGLTETEWRRLPCTETGSDR